MANDQPLHEAAADLRAILADAEQISATLAAAIAPASDGLHALARWLEQAMTEAAARAEAAAGDDLAARRAAAQKAAQEALRVDNALAAAGELPATVQHTHIDLEAVLETLQHVALRLETAAKRMSRSAR